MKRRTPTRLLAGLTTVAALVATGLTTAAPATAAEYSLPITEIEGRDLLLNGRTKVIEDAFGSTPTAMGQTWTNSYNCGDETRDFLTVVGGVLAMQHVAIPRECNGNGPPRLETTTYGPGWGQMTQLVGANYYLFALHQNGTLYRYRYNQTTQKYTSAGSVPGFGTVKSMALVHSDARKVVLLMNLSGGSLYQVTLPNVSTMKATAAPVRTSTWNAIDQLTTASDIDGSVDLQGVDVDTHRAYRYDLGPLRGTTTRIASLGAVRGTWNTPLSQSGGFDYFPFLGAP